MAYIKKTNNPNMGRPTSCPLTHDIRVRIDDETFNKLDEYCNATEKNKAETIRIAIKEYLSNND